MFSMIYFSDYLHDQYLGEALYDYLCYDVRNKSELFITSGEFSSLDSTIKSFLRNLFGKFYEFLLIPLGCDSA